MRTNIFIDDALLRKAMRASGLKTKRATIEEALRLYVRTKARARILDFAGKIEWDGDLDELRQSRVAENQGTYHQ